MPRKKKESKKPEEPLMRSFDEYLKAEMKRTGLTAGQVIEETFGCGFVRYTEETKGQTPISAWTGVSIPTEKDKRLAEFRKLRKEFAPVSQCVDYLKTVILGSGLDVQIADPKNETQKEIKEVTENFIEQVRQDIYMKGLFRLTDVLVDEALQVGSAAAEIVYEANPTFDEYKENQNPRMEEISVIEKNKSVKKEILLIDPSEPQWNDEVIEKGKDKGEIRKGLGGIVRLKIIRDAINRLILYRNPKTWEAMYWTLDEVTPQTLEEQVRGKKRRKTQVIRYLPWQMFWLTLNLRNWDINGESVIGPVYSIAKALQRILESVTEGIYRAGNKKYFIITGTEKRPWSSPYIRDVMSQIKEMGEKSWTTVPVPAGFDIKDIGGEVFEAQDIINILLTLIAHGMNCPKEVVGLASRGSGERQLTNSHIEIERMGTNFKNAVEDQLFARNVWCHYGKIKMKQSGRSFETVFVPQLKVGTQGLMSPIGRLEVCIKLMNLANPLDPRGKYRAEREIYNIMGWDDVPLPTMEEIEAELEKEAKMAEKLGKKRQGKPEPQTRERQLKRQEGMFGQKQTQRGQAKTRGSTRKPKDVVETKKPKKPKDDKADKN